MQCVTGPSDNDKLALAYFAAVAAPEQHGAPLVSRRTRARWKRERLSMIPLGLFSSTPSPTTATMDVSTSEIANAFANFFVVTQWPVMTTVICGFLVAGAAAKYSKTRNRIGIVTEYWLTIAGLRPGGLPSSTSCLLLKKMIQRMIQLKEYFRDNMPFIVAIADDRSERSGLEMENDDQYFPQSQQQQQKTTPWKCAE